MNDSGNSNNNASLDFKFILASSVHDMKNSLSMLLHSIEEITVEVEELQLPIGQRMATLQYETARVNNDLVQLLSLYRLDNDLLRANVDEVYVKDFLQEQAARYAPLLNMRQVEFELDCPEDLVGYFDEDLVAGVINNVLANSLRYSNKQLRLTASEANGYLRLDMEDDGEGFPAKMLEQPQNMQTGVDFQSGSTHLGLYFAHKIAELHQQRDKQGYIRLDNESSLSGGRFSLFLP